MTVPNDNITSGPYVGNGLVDTYDYDFAVNDKSEIRVFETDDSDVQTELTVDIDFTVTGVGDDDGGTVVRIAGNLPTGYQWFVRSNILATQETAFQSQGGFFPDVHEGSFDKLTRLIQQILDTLRKSLHLPHGYNQTDDSLTELPIPEANTFPRWNDDATGLVNEPNRNAEFDSRVGTLETEMDVVEGRATVLEVGLAAEIQDRTDADAVLQNNINNEAVSRSAGDSVLQNNINNEAVSRSAGDANLQAQLSGSEPLQASQFSPIAWHDQTIGNSVTIPDNKNAWSFGPTMTVASGQTVTVGANSFWTIANGEVV